MVMKEAQAIKCFDWEANWQSTATKDSLQAQFFHNSKGRPASTMLELVNRLWEANQTLVDSNELIRNV
jgi:hypothetical protein